MYALDLLLVPSSLEKSSGLDAHMRWYASCSTSFIISSGTVIVKNQNLSEPYSMAWSRRLRPVIDMCAIDLHAAILCFTSLYFFLHHSSSSMLFPMGTPKALMVSPSFTHASPSMIPVGARWRWRFSFPRSCPSLFVAFSLIAVA